MGYLLDTHTIMWYVGNSPNPLSLNMKELISNNENYIYLSSVSLWEIAIKVNLGKLTLSLTFDKFLDRIMNSDFNILQIENEYLRKLADLPFLHKDPFDRLLIATAVAENLVIITADESIHKYDVACIF